MKMNGYAHRVRLRSSIEPNNPQEKPEIPQSHTFLMLEPGLTMMIVMEAPLQEVWDRMMRDLERGARDRNDALHTFAFSSLSLQGSPATRLSVMLRAFEKQRRCIRFHSDLRSTKIQELKRDPRVSALFTIRQKKPKFEPKGWSYCTRTMQWRISCGNISGSWDAGVTWRPEHRGH